MSTLNRKQILRFIDEFGEWPRSVIAMTAADIIQDGFVSEEDGKPQLTSLGELEIDCPETTKPHV